MLDCLPMLPWSSPNIHTKRAAIHPPAKRRLGIQNMTPNTSMFQQFCTTQDWDHIWLASIDDRREVDRAAQPYRAGNVTKFCHCPARTTFFHSRRRPMLVRCRPAVIEQLYVRISVRDRIVHLSRPLLVCMMQDAACRL